MREGSDVFLDSPENRQGKENRKWQGEQGEGKGVGSQAEKE